MTAVRLACAALLALSGALAGWSRSAALSRYLALLTQLDTALGRMEEEIGALERPLEAVFSALAGQGPEPLRAFFAQLSAGTGSAPMRRLWPAALETLELEREASETLLALSDVLGRRSASAQASEIALARRRLEEQAARLRQERERRCRLYPGLGACLGAMLAVVLF